MMRRLILVVCVVLSLTALALADHGLAALARNPHLRAGLNVHRGKITHKAVAESLGLSFDDPAGLMAA